MTLAQIESDAENGAIAAEVKILGIATPIWVGGKSVGPTQTLEWGDGTVIWRAGMAPSGVYTNFASGQPTPLAGSCVQMTSSGAQAGTWANAVCSGQQAYVCQNVF